MKSGTRVHARLSKLVREACRSATRKSPCASWTWPATKRRSCSSCTCSRKRAAGNWGYVPVVQGRVPGNGTRDEANCRSQDRRAGRSQRRAGRRVTWPLPNVNRALLGLNGRLLPFNVFRFLYRNLKQLQECRIFGIASLEKFRHMGITSLLLMQDILWAVDWGTTSARRRGSSKTTSDRAERSSTASTPSTTRPTASTRKASESSEPGRYAVPHWLKANRMPAWGNAPGTDYASTTSAPAGTGRPGRR